MKRPAKLYEAFLAAGLLVLLMSGFAGQAFADKKPQFVYVANSGAAVSADKIETFSVTATAVCGDSQCFQPIAISGTFTLDATTGIVTGGTMYMTDASDLKSSPLAVPFDLYLPSDWPGNTEIFFLVPGRTSKQSPSYVDLIFPFTPFPTSYSGGPLCTLANNTNCYLAAGGAEIGTADVNPSLYPSTLNGLNLASAVMTSGSVTLVGTSNGSQGTGNVSGYVVDSTTGALSPVAGSPFAAGTLPSSIAVDPSNKFIYVANQGSNNVSAYTLDSTTGALTAVSGSPFTAGASPHSVVVDPSGKFAYVVNECQTSAPQCYGNGSVSAYAINRNTGALTSVPGSPFAAGAYAFSAAIDPSGKFAYVENACSTNVNSGCIGNGNVSAYTINSITGGLTPVPGSPFAAGVTPDWVAVDPSGKFAYVADYCGIGFCASGTVSAFTIDSTTGALTPVPGSPYAAGTVPNTVAVDPSGKFVYVANECAVDYCASGIGSVSAFAIDSASGALTPVLGSPFAAGERPKSLAIVGQSNVPFEDFRVKVVIDEDRKPSFMVAGFFKLGKGSDGIHPLSENVELQVGSFSATIPAGSFKEEFNHTFKFEGRINDADLRITFHHVGWDDFMHRKDHKQGTDYLFTAEGKGDFPAPFVNPVTVGLTIGDDEGSATVRADIEK